MAKPGKWVVQVKICNYARDRPIPTVMDAKMRAQSRLAFELLLEPTERLCAETTARTRHATS